MRIASLEPHHDQIGADDKEPRRAAQARQMDLPVMQRSFADPDRPHPHPKSVTVHHAISQLHAGTHDLTKFALAHYIYNMREGWDAPRQEARDSKLLYIWRSRLGLDPTAPQHDVLKAAAIDLLRRAAIPRRRGR